MIFKQVPIQFNEREHGQSFVKLSYPLEVMFQILLLMITKIHESLGTTIDIFISIAMISELSTFFLGYP